MKYWLRPGYKRFPIPLDKADQRLLCAVEPGLLPLFAQHVGVPERLLCRARSGWCLSDELREHLTKALSRYEGSDQERARSLHQELQALATGQEAAE